FVASSTRPKEVSDYFAEMPFAASVVARGDTKTTVRLFARDITVDLRVVKPSEFSTAWHHFTGSSEHNVALRHHAKMLGYKINEYGVFREGNARPIPVKTEEDLFAIFCMGFIQPEIREGLGAI